MGVDVELVEGIGPVRARPVETMADVEALGIPEPGGGRAVVLETVRPVREQLEPERALIGFCGGPFTVAGDLVEGRPSREFARTKALTYRAAQRSGTRRSTSSRRRSPATSPPR